MKSIVNKIPKIYLNNSTAFLIIRG